MKEQESNEFGIKQNDYINQLVKDDDLMNNSMFNSTCNQFSETQSIENSLLNPIYAEDIEEIFEQTKSEQIKRTFKRCYFT